VGYFQRWVISKLVQMSFWTTLAVFLTLRIICRLNGLQKFLIDERISREDRENSAVVGWLGG
jgi:hypothetical protein